MGPMHRLAIACLALCQSGLVLSQSLDAEFCNQFGGGNSSAVPFSFNNNAWGNITGQADGYQCLKLYDGGSSWTVTYKWTGDASTVKGFPYQKAHPSNLPTRLNSISQLNINGNWRTWVTGTENNDAGTQAAAYDQVGLIANVAIDLFLAPEAPASLEVSPPYEVMIWPWWVPTIWPLGYHESTPEKDTVTVNGVQWSLYHGINDPGQNVFSWLAKSNVTSMSGDYSPLLKYLYTSGYIPADYWVGSLEMGQEIKQATGETNFAATIPKLEIVRASEGEIQEAPTTTSIPSSSLLPSSSSSSSPPIDTPTSASQTSSEPVTSTTVAPSTKPTVAPATTSVAPTTTSTTTSSSSGRSTPSPTSARPIPSTTSIEPVAVPATTTESPVPTSSVTVASTTSIESSTTAPPSTSPTTTMTTTTTSSSSRTTTANSTTATATTTTRATTTTAATTTTSRSEALSSTTPNAAVATGKPELWLLVPALLAAAF